MNFDQFDRERKIQVCILKNIASNQAILETINKFNDKIKIADCRANELASFAIQAQNKIDSIKMEVFAENHNVAIELKEPNNVMLEFLQALSQHYVKLKDLAIEEKRAFIDSLNIEINQ